MLKKLLGDSGKIQGQISVQVITRDGKIKKLFSLNWLGKKLFNLGLDLRIPVLTGSWGNTMMIQNTITYAGYAGMASRINGAGSEAAFTYLAVGTGTTASSTADTTLETELTDSGLERASATCTRVTTDQANDTAQLTKTWVASSSKSVTEAGILNANSSGVLLGRQVFSAVGVDNGDSFALTYKVKVAV